MENVLDYIKENILAIIAIVISLLAFIHTKRSDKSNIKREIAKKKAELKSLSSMTHFFDGTTMNNTIVRKTVLLNEIEELEKML